MCSKLNISSASSLSSWSVTEGEACPASLRGGTAKPLDDFDTRRHARLMRRLAITIINVEVGPIRKELAGDKNYEIDGYHNMSNMNLDRP